MSGEVQAAQVEAQAAQVDGYCKTRIFNLALLAKSIWQRAIPWLWIHAVIVRYLRIWGSAPSRLETSRLQHVFCKTHVARRTNHSKQSADYSMYPWSIIDLFRILRIFTLSYFGQFQYRIAYFYLRAAISDCLLIGFIRATETLRKNWKK